MMLMKLLRPAHTIDTLTGSRSNNHVVAVRAIIDRLTTLVTTTTTRQRVIVAAECPIAVVPLRSQVQPIMLAVETMPPLFIKSTKAVVKVEETDHRSVSPASMHLTGRS